MFPVAILQGRLSPSLDGRFQFFPYDWESEFAAARQIDFYGIEWLVDWPEVENGSNPILSFDGLQRVAESVRRSNVPVTSICADYFMKHRPVGGGEWRQVLWSLINAATITAERIILLPLLEGNAPRDERDDADIRESLMRFVPALDVCRVSLAFETEMHRERLVRFVDSFDSLRVGAYYDIGNATSYGFDCPADIRLLGDRILGVHVKDRAVGSSQSVMLGDGDADLPGCVRALADIGWDGCLVMQAWRGVESYRSDAERQLAHLNAIQKEVLDG